MPIIKTAELSGRALDYAVAKAEGLVVKTFGSDNGGDIIAARDEGRWKVIVGGTTMEWLLSGIYHPSADAKTGQPILEREGIQTYRHNRIDPEQPHVWTGICYSSAPSVWTLEGPTMLIAGLRAWVASKFGREVEVPEIVAS